MKDESEIGMKTLSVTELRVSLSRIEEILDDAGGIVVTRRGKPIARIVRFRGIPPLVGFRTSMPRMKVPSEVLIRQDRDER
jgi:antitoxin (DNA-binding transcriptional repressor) of toxin-antitoxin stability system